VFVASASSDGTVRLWRRPQVPRVALAHVDGLVRQLAFAPDRASLAVATDRGGLEIHALPGGATTRVPGQTVAISRLAYSPRGTWLASKSGNGRGVLADPQTGGTVWLDAQGVNDVAFAPDDTRVVVAYSDSELVVRELPGGSPVAIGRHPEEVRDVRFLDDRTVIAAGTRGAVIAWDLRTRQPTALYRHTGDVLFLEVTARGQVVSAGADGAVVIWSRSTGAVRHSIGARPRALAISPGGSRLVVADAAGEVRMLDMTGQPVMQARYPTPINGLCFVDDELALGASDEGALLAWRSGTGLEDVWTTDASGNTAIACRSVDAGGVPEIATATRDGKVVVWRTWPRGSPPSVRALLRRFTGYRLDRSQERT
jgi:WD40 repeat protein